MRPGDTRWAGPAIALPKPSRITGWVSARIKAPQIGQADASRVVEQFGARLLGRPSNLPLSWRNRLVVVRTSTGKKVLKQYRDTSSIETVTHEHSIIDHLAGRDFPSTRLEHTPSGSSVVTVDDHLHALFVFEPARHLAATVLSTGQRRALTAEAGRALARLHRELIGFRPTGRHHLGSDPCSGGRARDLEWHLAAIDRLRGEPPKGGPADGDGRWLREQATSLRRDLVDAAATVRDEQLPELIIHGDYGSHNLLFRRDGTVVVHDFELARLDWRLLDIVIASLRLPPDYLGDLVAGYRREGDLPDRELRVLPALWRYHLLSGAVRSWQGHAELGGPARLATARARVVRAGAGPHEMLARWQ